MDTCHKALRCNWPILCVTSLSISMFKKKAINGGSWRHSVRRQGKKRNTKLYYAIANPNDSSVSGFIAAKVYIKLNAPNLAHACEIFSLYGLSRFTNF